jgi:protein arginine kinase activator
MHYTQVVNGVRDDKHLCAACARDEGVVGPAGFTPVFNIFNLLGEDVNKPQPVGGVCPSCGATLAAFGKNSLFGCPDCYGAFGDFTDGLLAKVHGAGRHRGKKPRGFIPAAVEEDPAALLKKQLEDAIKNEEYETAARLRDEIRGLQNSGGGAAL